MNPSIKGVKFQEDDCMRSIFLTGLIVLVGISILYGMNNKKKKKNRKELIGEKAPDFRLKDENGKERSLSEFKGKRVVLYFYPKDDTPGCRKEACSFRDNYSLFEKAGIVVLGVSYDSPESHKKFKEKYNLPFILLSDQDKKVADMYLANKGLFGKKFANRVTYLINEDGTIIYVFEKVDVTKHAQEVINIFNQQR
jgi:peroxiredoxin Q/BCP